ncbi:arginine--tRNA ligase [Tatumella ptyseos]|uniref:arginine--tRNA ligase n=1 Tax=Tatumella ptyseos TaxID=82987 RepID=UPI0026EFEB42|nr:arginine--tRNA ligase [Tatumella ptyseos]WKX27240.1 arginine--tRNA ligase [Tatumella ptyseos]
MNISARLSTYAQEALHQLEISPVVAITAKVSLRPELADYQIDSMLPLAKIIKIPPRQLAEQVVEQMKKNVHFSGMIHSVEVAGAGFINIRLNNSWLAEAVAGLANDPRLGVSLQDPTHIVIDYSSPNVAKEMHVGHLRSTIIGDASVRTLSFLGHKVTKVNHIGDWGTQFGMLIAYLEEADHQDQLSLSDLEGFYREAKKRYEQDAEFSHRARQYVVKLQQGDEYCRQMWQRLVEISMQQNQHNYDLLGVSLTPDDIRGESAYNTMLPEIVDDLLQRHIAQEEQGSVVVYLDTYKNKQGEPMGVVIRKKDGGYLYTTTDIACAKYRYETLKADRVLYYIDARQHQHLMMAWAIVRKAGYVPEDVALEHHKFGMMLDKQGQPFKTREGGTIKLSELLAEAVSRAKRIIEQKSPHITGEALNELATIIGIGAVKYADLSKNRTTDYIFDWDSMLSFEGNTAPYIQYAGARIHSLLEKARLQGLSWQDPRGVEVMTDEERAIVLAILQLEERINLVAREGLPNMMCQYLYELASLFSRFYATTPILTEGDGAKRKNRLYLTELTGKALALGLSTLGIQVPERM